MGIVLVTLITESIPTHAGPSCSVWKRRPLPPTLLDYAAADVQHLFKMKDKWRHAVTASEAKTIANARMQKTIIDGGRAPDARVDFTWSTRRGVQYRPSRINDYNDDDDYYPPPDYYQDNDPYSVDPYYSSREEFDEDRFGIY